MRTNRWLFIGTDLRIQACKKMMEAEGEKCVYIRTDQLNSELINTFHLFQPTHIVCPMIQMKGKIPFDQLKEKPHVFVGMTTTDWLNDVKKHAKRVSSYLEEELYVWENAYITAEAFLIEYYREMKQMVNNRHFYIAGFGRVGKMIAKILSQLNGQITIVSRNNKQLAEAKSFQYKILLLEDFKATDASVLINTIPAKWLHLPNDEKMHTFDLASAPGCLTNEETIEYYKLLPGLPGKHFPIDAASALHDAINRMMGE